MSDFVELKRVFNMVLSRWWLILILTVLGAGIGYQISQVQTKIYQATTTMLVGELMQSTSLNREDVQMSVSFAQTYSDIAIRQPVLQGVVEKLKLDEPWQDLKERVRVTYVEGTQLIVIKVEDTSPERAQLIAGEIANQLIMMSPTNAIQREGGEGFPKTFVQDQMEQTREKIQNGQQRIVEIETALDGTLSEEERAALQAEKTDLDRLLADYVKNYVELTNLAAAESEPNSLSIIEPAQAGINPIRPRPRLNILFGAIIGLVVALAIIFVWEYLDDTFRSMNDLAQFPDVVPLGAIEKIKGKTYADKLVTKLKPFSPATESFRMIRSKIHFGSDTKSSKSIVITSPGPGEGKSITAANLAAVLALANVKTVLVDADFRNPVLHEIFNLSNETGLADSLVSPECEVGYCLKESGIDNLSIITSGKPLINSSELLGTERMAAILRTLEENANMVIIDSPPALIAADATILSNQVDGVILVIRPGVSKRNALRQTLFDLKEAKANVLGAIYNQARKDNPLASYNLRHHVKNLVQWFKTLISRGASLAKKTYHPQRSG